MAIARQKTAQSAAYLPESRKIAAIPQELAPFQLAARTVWFP
jgi:hypothetical protein